MTPIEWATFFSIIIGTFYGGAVTEAETKGAVTKSINYEVNATRQPVCKEYYPKIIITDE